MQNLLSNVKKLIKTFYKRTLRSIAFYPVLIGSSLLAFALITLFLEDHSVIINLKRTKPYLFIENIETARTILSTLLAGILSLTVFSFTMVMVVLSQATSNFSPRLLPGLISNRKHQLILGVYIGTLLYTTVTLIYLGANARNNNSVGISTTIAAILGFYCVILFVSFIHSISSAIQIQNIVSGIVSKTDEKLDVNLKEQVPKALDSPAFIDYKYIITANKAGYFQEFDVNLLDHKAIENDLKIIVVPYSGLHINIGDILLKADRLITKEEKKTLNFSCVLTDDLHDGEHPFLGLIKLMEVAVRAMSPGVNDPGTALDVINKLTPLLTKTQQLPPYYHKLVGDQIGIEVNNSNISTKELLRCIIQPIRFYVKKDARLMASLVKTLQFLNKAEHISKTDKRDIEIAIESLIEDVERFIVNKSDKNQLLKIASSLQS